MGVMAVVEVTVEGDRSHGKEECRRAGKILRAGTAKIRGISRTSVMDQGLLYAVETITESSIMDSCASFHACHSIEVM